MAMMSESLTKEKPELKYQKEVKEFDNDDDF
jgi:hypothetical protein